MDRLPSALRQFRNSVVIAIMARDLTGKATFDETLKSITALADQTIDMAYQTAMATAIRQHGLARDASGQPQDLMIVGMGKLGGEELNVSSDVDLIYVFSEEGQTDASTPGSRSIDTSTFFTKVGRRIAALLGEVTGDGIVFRVDLRLRPNGDVGPLAVSLGMLEEYFIVQGREWERYAWIKARVVNQAHAQSPESFKQSVRGLHDVVRPFVFRRYLDFNVLAALRELHSQIRQEAARRALGRESHMGGQYPPVDIKLGPGGIREVEFIAQLFQLIRGGKEEPLRARGTREVLTYLSTSGRLDIEEVAMLQEAYQFWRNLEHRLQYLDDAQTHVLPGRAETIAHIADSMGFLNSESFIKALETTQDRVRGSFERLFAGVAADPSPQPNGVPDIELQMDALREVHHAHLFRLLVQDLDGRWQVETLSDHLSAMADAVLQVTLDTVWGTLAKRHREKPHFAVIAYGRLGGKELGYASDLDLIFLYDDDHELAPEIYARFAQRVNVWLSTATAAGSLFDIDLRLRPNGNAGLLVTALRGFIEYQTQHAWIWEHQALTRARFCAGDTRIGRAFEAERNRILQLERPVSELLEEVLAMRGKMHEGHPNTTAQFDIKHDRGGMVDIEFIVQTLILRFAHDYPELTGNLGNIALLRLAGALRLIDEALAERVGNAYREYRRRQHAERLCGAQSARISPAELTNERAAVAALWDAVFSGAPRVCRTLQEIHSARR